jgi:hypothetical protein
VRAAEDLRLYRCIATMDKTAPLPPLRNQKPTCAKAAALARQWQLDKPAVPPTRWNAKANRWRVPTYEAAGKL